MEDEELDDGSWLGGSVGDIELDEGEGEGKEVIVGGDTSMEIAVEVRPLYIGIAGRADVAHDTDSTREWKELLVGRSWRREARFLRCELFPTPGRWRDADS
jgi:hypothetical protein